MTPHANGNQPAQAPATTAQIISLSELQAPANASQGSPAPLLREEANPLHQVKATVTVCVGSTVLTIGELLGARSEQVIRLDSAVSDPVELLIEGRVVARGQLVAVGECFGVRITELPQPLKV